MLVVGSKALILHGADLTPVDTDFVGTFDEINAFFKDFYKGKIAAQYPLSGNKMFVQLKDKSIFESEIAWSDSTGAEFMQLAKDDSKSFPSAMFLVPSLDLLYALKMSHRYLKNSPHFLKTMKHIHWMREQGATIRPEHMDWFKRREKETYSYSHPKLNQSKKSFFNPDEGVIYVYDHDSIHMAVKQMDKPAYNYFKPDEAEVYTSKKLFFECDRQIQLNAVLEESYVLALERSQIPYPDTARKWSFDTALMKVCTSITSGWFREFAWENYNAVQALYNDNYVDVFKEGVSQGIVKPFK